MKTIESLKKEIIETKKQLLETVNSSTSETYISLFENKDYMGLENKLSLLQRQYYFTKYLKRIAYNDELDIYDQLEGDEMTKKYVLSLHDKYQEIGEVRVNYDETRYDFYGNIGYTIYEAYRGHNYAYKALELLTDIFLEKGLTKVVITAYTNNIPSIKTIEKFGGVQIEPTEESLYTYNMYEVDLLKKKNIKVLKK